MTKKFKEKVKLFLESIKLQKKKTLPKKQKKKQNHLTLIDISNTRVEKLNFILNFYQKN